MTALAALAEQPVLRAIAGALGIAGSIASGFFFVLVPALTVPKPDMYLFFVAWLVPVGLSIRWWRSHPWRALLVPIVATGLAIAALWAGGTFLGWAP